MSSSGVVAAQSTNSAAEASTQTKAASGGEDAQDAQTHLQKSIKVIHQMQSDAGMKRLLQHAKAVYIVPDFAHAALGVGARGGAGVLFVRNGSKWGKPAFYNMGGVSAGAEAGVEAGAIALVLNSQKALDSFKQDNNFSLNAEAGLTIINWSGKEQGSVGKGDVVAWADTEGGFGALAVSVTDINFDEKETSAFYGTKVASAGDVISGKVTAPHSPALNQALAALSGGTGTTATGSSGTAGTGMSGTSPDASNTGNGGQDGTPRQK